MVVENGNDGGGSAGASGGAAGVGEGTGGAAGAAAAGATGGVAAGAGKTPEGAATGAGQTEGTAGEPAKYTPNFKYKVTAPQGSVAARMEKEIPEWARPFITSADIEKNVRELFEKSEGIDAVKQHRDQLVTENSQMREEWGPLVQNAQIVVGHLQRGDMDSFFESLNIPENVVMRWVLHRMQLRENPSAMQSHEQMRQLQLQNQQLQNQVQQFSGSYEQLAVQQRTIQLESTLARPEIHAAVQAFDGRVGNPGAFRAEVIKRGNMYAAMQKDVSVEQAVMEVLQLMGWQGQNAQPAAGQNGAGNVQVPGAAAGTAGAQGGEPKPTFPNVRGKGTSPAKRVIKSTDQLRELSRQRA